MNIKYRVYDHQEEVYVDNKFEYDFAITSHGVLIKIIDHYQNEEIQYPDIDDYIVEQSTWLRDKNGKEIYEGDVIRYLDSIYQVVWDEQYPNWFILWDDDSHDLDIWMEKLVHIIGNIHENPELLNN